MERLPNVPSLLIDPPVWTLTAGTFDGGWTIETKDEKTHAKRSLGARYAFLGAGGAALTLLQKSGIPEADGFAGFPVSGIWLRSGKQEIATRHLAKVYGMAASGSPPMSVPHLDTRYVDGKRWLLFGPFAGFSTKFLKHGSLLDLPMSIRPDNILPLLAVGRDADFTLVEFGAKRIIKADELWTRHRISPYVGRASKVRVTHTYVRGCPVWADGGVASGSPKGQFLRPTHT